MARRHMPTDGRSQAADSELMRRVLVVIFQSRTPAGKLFDLLLIVAILASVAAVMLESVAAIGTRHHLLLSRIEWFFTIAFTLE